LRLYVSDRKRPGTENLADVPFDQLEAAFTGSREWIAGGNASRLLFRGCTNYVYSKRPLWRRAGEKDGADFVLVPHPHEVLVKGYTSTAPRLHRVSTAQADVPHTLPMETLPAPR
jgi:hypothetical protein